MTTIHGEVIDGTWAYLNGMIADGPCWTCRRRRLRCDNIKPSCVKCMRAGLDCLGYGPRKPLVWVGRPGRVKRGVNGAKTMSPSTRYSTPDSEIATPTCTLTITGKLPTPRSRLPSPEDGGAAEYLSYCRQNVSSSWSAGQSGVWLYDKPAC